MPEVDGGALVARVLGEQGVTHLFAINGGHTFPIFAHLKENGVKLIHMRHEQAAAYAADGWARSTGRPGVCCVTAGCGLTNAITGLTLAAMTNSGVVCIAGQHPSTEDGLGSFQEAYGSEICGSFAKYTRRVLDWSTIEVHVRQAFRAAGSAPQGVALVEIPQNILYQRAEDELQRPGARVYEPDDLRGQGDPRSIDRAVDLLLNAERPLLVGGDGLFWSGAAAELRELAELIGSPVYCRRAGQGAVPEDHPLAVRGAWKKPFTERADVVASFGFRFWSGEHFGQPPTWSAAATHIQVDPDPLRIGIHVGAEVPIVGDPKLVLRQMIELVRERRPAGPTASRWLEELAEVRAAFETMTSEREQAHHDDVPIHPDRLLRDLVTVLDPSSTLVVDSFTLSGYVSHWFSARFPGQLIDAGPLAPVGHSIGMAIGAGLARPSAPVVAVIGDGGIGIGGFDLETAARYNVPVVAVLWNNSSWGPNFEQMPMLRGRSDPFDMLPGIRYDRIAQELGCHGERVEKPEEFRPALERALSAGKPALVDVVGDKRIGHPTLGGNLLGSTVA